MHFVSTETESETAAVESLNGVSSSIKSECEIEQSVTQLMALPDMFSLIYGSINAALP